jgi:hypothetical protein
MIVGYEPVLSASGRGSQASPCCLQESVTELAAGGTLHVGQTLASAGGGAKLVFQQDGNLVVRSPAVSTLWVTSSLIFVWR